MMSQICSRCGRDLIIGRFVLTFFRLVPHTNPPASAVTAAAPRPPASCSFLTNAPAACDSSCDGDGGRGCGWSAGLARSVAIAVEMGALLLYQAGGLSEECG
jgi:hypothetical protein